MTFDLAGPGSVAFASPSSPPPFYVCCVKGTRRAQPAANERTTAQLPYSTLSERASERLETSFVVVVVVVAVAANESQSLNCFFRSLSVEKEEKGRTRTRRQKRGWPTTPTAA